MSKIDFTLMLDPAGDARHPGRVIADEYLERGLTMQCAQHIKLLLERSYPAVRVVLTRVPGETVTQEQKATFANRIADLYVSIHFYQQTKNPTVSCYYFCIDPLLPPPLAPHKQALRITPVSQAHHAASSLSRQYAHDVFTHLKNTHKALTVYPPTGIPFAPLKGITCPAYALEVSVENAQEIPTKAQLLTHALEQIIDQAIRNQL